MNKWIVGLLAMVILGGITEPCIGQVSVSAAGVLRLLERLFESGGDQGYARAGHSGPG